MAPELPPENVPDDDAHDGNTEPFSRQRCPCCGLMTPIPTGWPSVPCETCGTLLAAS